MEPRLLQALIPILIIGVVLAFRLRSMSRRQPLNVARLWLAPLILMVIAISTIAAHPPGTLGLAACAAALAVGGLLGWHRGKLTRIERDPATGALFQQASPGEMILLIAIIAIRFAARSYLQGQTAPGKFDQHTLIVTDALLCFAVGLIAMTRIEIGLRARALLAERPAA